MSKFLQEYVHSKCYAIIITLSACSLIEQHKINVHVFLFYQQFLLCYMKMVPFSRLSILLILFQRWHFTGRVGWGLIEKGFPSSGSLFSNYQDWAKSNQKPWASFQTSVWVQRLKDVDHPPLLSQAHWSSRIRSFKLVLYGVLALPVVACQATPLCRLKDFDILRESTNLVSRQHKIQMLNTQKTHF